VGGAAVGEAAAVAVAEAAMLVASTDTCEGPSSLLARTMLIGTATMRTDASSGVSARTARARVRVLGAEC
jgi:hypothetical protein